MPLLLSEAEVDQLLTMADTINAVESAFRDGGNGTGSAQPRRRVRADGTVLHVMSGAAPSLGISAVKAYTTGPLGATFIVLAFSTHTGELEGIIEGDKLGQLRTGAASAVATKYMSRENAEVLGIYGTGWQARTQIEAIKCVRPIKLVKCFSRSSERRAEFVRIVKSTLSVEVEAVSEPDLVCRGADVVVTATSSVEPVLLGAWLMPGTHLNIMGSNSALKRETDDECIRRASIVVADDRESAKIEGGDLIVAVEKGILNWNSVRELGDVVAGFAVGRPNSEAITLFKSHGSGLEDAAAAAVVIARAREHGIGTNIPMFKAPPPGKVIG